jgi:segregation and condensation protein B
MRSERSQPPAESKSRTAPPSEKRDTSPLSLSRLRDAFAAMLGTQAAPPAEEGTQFAIQSTASPELHASGPPLRAPRSPLVAAEINPRSVVEALLFVGRPDNQPFSARELAAAMRGVSPAEITAAITELNTVYEAESAPYRIDESHSGYRLVLREEFGRMRDKFLGRVREAKLSSAAIEVLAIVAYNQPVTIDQINELREAPSGAALSTLVRRQLVRLERPAEKGAAPRYWTTDRFLRLYGLESLSALPRTDELEKA